MKTSKQPLYLDIPEGYTLIDFRVPKDDEYFLRGKEVNKKTGFLDKQKWPILDKMLVQAVYLKIFRFGTWQKIEKKKKPIRMDHPWNRTKPEGPAKKIGTLGLLDLIFEPDEGDHAGYVYLGHINDHEDMK